MCMAKSMLPQNPSGGQIPWVKRKAGESKAQGCFKRWGLLVTNFDHVLVPSLLGMSKFWNQNKSSHNFTRDHRILLWHIYSNQTCPRQKRGYSWIWQVLQFLRGSKVMPIMKKETKSKWALPVVYVWSKHLTLYSITSFLIFWLWNLFCLFQKMEKFGSLSSWK